MAQPLLDGMTLQYLYPDGRRVKLTLADGKLAYRWLAGPFEGVEESGLVYNARRTASGDYIVNWHDTQNHNFATLTISLDHGRVYGPAILGYTGKDPMTLFEEASIEMSNREDG
jgi:hypothetical protein